MRQLCTEKNRTSDECYFLPLSNCTNVGRYVINLWDTSEGVERVGRRTGLYSETLIMGTLLAWVLRPQHELQEAIVQYGNALGLGQNGARHRSVAMHMRRGDKYSLHAKHMRNHSWRIAPESFAVWGRRVAAVTGAERVLYMSDDTSLNLSSVAERLFKLAPAPRACAPSSHAGNYGQLRDHMRTTSTTGYKSIAAHPEIWTSRLHKIAQHTSECGPEIWMDDGIQFYAGVLLLAQCASFIGLQISNIGMAVTELMATQRHPPPIYDVLNDVYRGPFLSDERVWINGVHNKASLRPLGHDRLALGDGRASHGCWSCTSAEPLLPPEEAARARAAAAAANPRKTS